MSDQAEATFAELGCAYIDEYAELHPDAATERGDHRFDNRLPDYSTAALAGERHALDGWAARLSALDTGLLSREHQVDAALLTDHVALRSFEIDELREHTWNPLLANPGRAIYRLLGLDFAPLPERLASVAGRLAQIPAALAAAREQLGPMPRVHIETAIDQFGGTIKLVTDEIDTALTKSPSSARQIDQVRPVAVAALTTHRKWLSAQLAGGEFSSPRIGAERFARKLSLTLNAEADADSILGRALAHLDQITEEITELAASLGGSAGLASASGHGVREVLDRLADDSLDNDTILGFCRDAFAQQIAFVRDAGLVTVYDDPVEVIEMPEIDRGVALAYCDSPGELETAPLPTLVGVSPTPADWPAERVVSFYREYNRHMAHDLMVHEAIPGHALQLQHAGRFADSTAVVRKSLRSSAFIEGWAVYAEELMARHGYPGDGDPRTIRMQQLKMQLRMTINAILDSGVHARGMTEAEAMALMMERGHQEEGEAAGKWRRAQLTSSQLSTYFVGYTEVADLARALKVARPDATERQRHDEMLAHGSPPARMLRSVVLT